LRVDVGEEEGGKRIHRRTTNFTTGEWRRGFLRRAERRKRECAQTRGWACVSCQRMPKGLGRLRRRGKLCSERKKRKRPTRTKKPSQTTKPRGEKLAGEGEEDVYYGLSGERKKMGELDVTRRNTTWKSTSDRNKKVQQDAKNQEIPGKENV